ncbi:hypothetical protein BDV95DRAFT_560331 [Massariosphaeria phaeospora]|uniref:DUF7704 domain-containing protein n=1 Tax=Massariosphaeria phaeospora TaxID=100035 RepID=A0A7C8MBI9_9PLEO|nr:hypothetical protein BDV95DRAFT_560331 [Massariosphaeria phaeospora]
MASQLPHIPLVYRVFLLWLEPLMAFNGAILCHFNAPWFLATMSAAAVYKPDSQVIFDQLAATYTLFAFNEAFVLRAAKDFKVWKTMMLGMLLCDTLHLYAAWGVLGTKVFLSPWLWRFEDWMAVGTLWVPVVLRICFLQHVGITEAKEKL